MYTQAVAAEMRSLSSIVHEPNRPIMAAPAFFSFSFHPLSFSALRSVLTKEDVTYAGARLRLSAWPTSHVTDEHVSAGGSCFSALRCLAYSTHTPPPPPPPPLRPFSQQQRQPIKARLASRALHISSTPSLSSNQSAASSPPRLHAQRVEGAACHSDTL
ncbi:hypothetical protein SRHO_G00120250 [Serrasalmus rhombeus]